MNWNSPETQNMLSKIKAIADREQLDEHQLFLRIPARLTEYPPATVKLGIEVVLGRGRSQKLGGWAENGFMTLRALEQATRAEIAAYHSSHFAGCSRVIEIGSGLGSDTAALASQAAQVVAYEADPVLAAMTRANLTLRGVNNVELRADFFSEDQFSAEQTAAPQRFDGMWSDPDRRPGGQRQRDPELCSPPLSLLIGLPISGPRGIKLSPASPLRDLPVGWSREHLAWGAECLELILWRGTSHPAASVFDIATNSRLPINIATQPSLDSEALTSGAILVEPHAAVLAAQGADSLYADIGAVRFELDTVYGVCQQRPPPSAWYRSFEVLEIIPFSLKKLGDALNSRGWNNNTEFKKRNFSEEPEEIRKKVKLPAHTPQQPASGVVLLTRVGAKQIAILAQRIP